MSCQWGAKECIPASDTSVMDLRCRPSRFRIAFQLTTAVLFLVASPLAFYVMAQSVQTGEVEVPISSFSRYSRARSSNYKFSRKEQPRAFYFGISQYVIMGSFCLGMSGALFCTTVRQLSYPPAIKLLR